VAAVSIHDRLLPLLQRQRFPIPVDRVHRRMRVDSELGKTRDVEICGGRPHAPYAPLDDGHHALREPWNDCFVRGDGGRLIVAPVCTAYIVPALYILLGSVSRSVMPEFLSCYSLEERNVPLVFRRDASEEDSGSGLVHVVIHPSRPCPQCSAECILSFHLDQHSVSLQVVPAAASQVISSPAVGIKGFNNRG
jgi:hypothetical protein